MDGIASISSSNFGIVPAPKEEIIPYTKNKLECIQIQLRTLYKSSIVRVGSTLFVWMPISMIIVGSVYLNQCPIQRYIPIWLIALGALGCLSFELLIIHFCCHLLKRNRGLSDKWTIWIIIIEILSLAWFIAGSIWVYSIRSYVDTSDAHSINFCHQVCYSFAFWVTTIIYGAVFTLGILFLLFKIANYIYSKYPIF